MTNTEPQQEASRREASAEKAASAREMRKIAQWLRTVKFRRALFGVSEKDVWKKIGELNEMYKAAVTAERVRYDTLLEQMREQYEQYLAGTASKENTGDEKAKEKTKLC